jgi:exodeoxyribonuclease VII small subunit
MTKSKNPKDVEERSFEQAIARLEGIVKEMEEGSLDLEKMMARFEEGMELVKFCTGKLNEVERRIEILIKQGEEAVAQPFDPGPEDGEA